MPLTKGDGEAPGSVKASRGPGGLNVSIDRRLCLGYANCLAAAPEVFALDGDGLAYVLQDEPGAALAEALHKAVRLCPTGAISVTQRP